MNWGIIGTGKIATKFASTLLLMRDEGEKLVSVASRTLEKAESFKDEYKAEKAYGCYCDIYKDKDIDILYIATPNNLHYQEIKEALLNGKHVLSEKPMTLIPSEMEELYQIAKERNLFLLEGYWVYFLPASQKLREVYPSIGEIEEISLTYGFFSEGKRRERKFLSCLGGGALLDIGIYNIGFLTLLDLLNPSIEKTRVMMNEYGTDKWSETKLLYNQKTKVTTINLIGEDTERICSIKGKEGSIYIPDFQHFTSFTVNRGEKSESYSFPFDYNGFEYEIREAKSCIEEKKSSSSLFTPLKSIDTARTMYRIRKLWNMKFQGVDND